MTSTLFRTRRLTAVLAAAAALAVGLSACSSSGDGSGTSSGGSGSSAAKNTGAAGGSGSGGTVNLVAYSVPKPAYDDLATAFAQTADGKGVKVQGSYGPSGAQSKAVLAGQKADYVGFSVEPDLTKLVPSKVDSDWNTGPTKGLVSDSVVVIVVRKGNPLKIKGWDDLVKPGVKIVTPDPASSGSAKWNILAAYSHVTATGGSPAKASDYLKNFYKHIVSRAASGAVATTQFTSGTGNVLISYEDEAITARQKGADVDYIVPDQTIRIENPAAVTKTAPAAAKKFLDYAESAAGQAIFVKHGFRPVVSGVPTTGVQGANDPSNPFPTPKTLVTIQQLGGWSVVNDKFFGDNGIVTKIGGSG